MVISVLSCLSYLAKITRSFLILVPFLIIYISGFSKKYKKPRELGSIPVIQFTSPVCFNHPIKIKTKSYSLPDSQWKKYSKDFIANVVVLTSLNRSFIFPSIMRWWCTAAAPGSAEGPKTGTGTTPLRDVCILAKIFTLVSLSVILDGPVLHPNLWL